MLWISPNFFKWRFDLYTRNEKRTKIIDHIKSKNILPAINSYWNNDINSNPQNVVCEAFLILLLLQTYSRVINYGYNGLYNISEIEYLLNV